MLLEDVHVSQISQKLANDLVRLALIIQGNLTEGVGCNLEQLVDFLLILKA